MMHVRFLAFACVSLAALMPAAADTDVVSGRVASAEAGARSAQQQVAQLFNRPPASIPNVDPGYQPAQAGDAATLGVRVDRLENQMRALTGQIEQLQFAQKRLDDQMKKFQQDVEFRFQDLGSKGGTGAPPAARPAVPNRRTDSGDPAATAGFAVNAPADLPPVTTTGSAVPITPSVGTRPRRGDAFDPTAHPDAPGAPRTLGTLMGTDDPAVIEAPAEAGRLAALPAGPLGGDGAPLDLSQGGRNAVAGRAPPAVAPPSISVAAPLVAPTVVMAPPAAGPVVASLPVSTTRDEFDTASAFYNSGQYDSAASSFRTFIDRHPKDRLVAEVTFLLGDSYTRLGRTREAAEQYLKLSTDMAKSSRAPEAMVRLGQSLEKLGAREQACATYGEVPRKFPAAPASIRQSADREAKRAQCAPTG